MNHDAGGSIEVSSNTIRNNHAFIPSAILSNLIMEVPKSPDEEDEFDIDYLDELEIEKRFVTMLSIEGSSNPKRAKKLDRDLQLR